jgi:hypothetical protein
MKIVVLKHLYVTWELYVILIKVEVPWTDSTPWSAL